MTLYTRDGREGRHWRSVRSAYRHWVRSVLPERPAYVVADSKWLVTFLANLQLSQVFTVCVVHGAHLMPGAADPHGELRASRRATLENVVDLARGY